MMRKVAAVAILSVALLFGAGYASPNPDLGLDIAIDFSSQNNPNVLASANVVGSATGDLQGAIGGYTVSKYNGSTGLIASGESLVSLVGNITVIVNNVLRNISVVASNRQTSPSCMFGSMNSTIDLAWASLDQAAALVTNIKTSTSAQNSDSMTSWVSMIQSAMWDIASYLDKLYVQVTAVMAAGPLTSSTVAANIKPATLQSLSGAISVMTTAEKGLTQTVRTIRTAFEQSTNVLNSYSNDMVNALISVNNTQRDYYNQVVSRITSFQNKVTSEANNGATDITNTQSRLNQFVQDSVTRSTAQALQSSITASTTLFSSASSTFSSSVQSQMTQLYTGAEAFVQLFVKSLVPVFDSSTFKLAATMSVGGTYAGSCQGKYGGAITNLDNNMRDGLNRCYNDYANTGYTDSFFSEYIQVIREQTRFIANRINFCLNLGSNTSNSIVKAGISKCFSEMVTMTDVILKDISVEVKVALSMINLESVAMVQRVELCATIMSCGLVAKAASLDSMLASCQTTNT